MANIKMTVRGIDAIRPPESGQVDYWDMDNPGFGLRVSYGGRKAWVAMYRHGNVKRRLTLGTYPALSLAEAREKAAAVHHAVQYEGTDPATAKKGEREAETFAELAADYIERHAKRNKRSWRKDILILEKDCLPRFGRRKAKDITRRDIIGMLDDIVARGAPIQANRTLEIVRKLFNWAVARDILTATPCYRVAKPSSENRSDRVLNEEEIRAIWQALTAEPPLTAATFKLRLLTAQRGAEVLAMRWDQISNGWWTIPGEVAKNGLAHRVPLSEPVLALLDAIRPLGSGSEWVFPGADGEGHRVAVHKAHTRVRRCCGISFVPHDLRRTAASYMTGMGISRLAVAKILNHVEAGITAVYDRHSYDAEKRAALDAWARRVEEIASGREMASANVVPLRNA
ncbi:MAG TPA: tyrosine-type recombinase/integrase [Stellaceae bacterium]|nr:tyrosine-type recombinase/integrase [Stellaceae bacterium]